MRTRIGLLAGFLCVAGGAEAAVNIEKLAQGCQDGKAKDCEKLADALSRSAPGAGAEATPELKAAVSRLTQKAALTAIAKTRYVRDEYRLAAFEALGDNALIVAVASDRGQSSSIRDALVRKLDDQELLFKMAADKSEDVGVRFAALATLTDLGRLVGLVGVGLFFDPFSPLKRIAEVPEGALALSAEARARLEAFAKTPAGLQSDAARDLLAGTKPSSWPTLHRKGFVNLTYREFDVAGMWDRHGRQVVRFPAGQMSFTASYRDGTHESQVNVPVSARFEKDRCYEVTDRKEGETWSPSFVEAPCPAAATP